jgi:hypothetical protein
MEAKMFASVRILKPDVPPKRYTSWSKTLREYLRFPPMRRFLSVGNTLAERAAREIRRLRRA